MGPENEATPRDGANLSPAAFLYLIKAWLELSLLMYFLIA